MFNELKEIGVPGELVIRKESLKAEKLGHLTPAQLNLIYENKWFHLLVPQSLGGAEMTLPDFARFMEKLAFVDGGFAWNVNLGAGANMFAGFMDQREAAKIFHDPKACIAGSGAKTGTARMQSKGFLIDGQWKYASGSAHATFFSLNAKLVGPPTESESADPEGERFRSFIVPAADVKVLDSWKVYGMKATSSRDFRVDSAWVPASYGFDLQSASPSHSSALYRFPFMLLAEINMLVMATGLAMRFDELLAIAQPKHDFLACRERVFELLDRLWALVLKSEEIPSALEQSYRKAVSDCAAASRQLVDRLYPYAGMKVVFEDTELSRVFRDFKVASQHALLLPTGLV